MNTKWRPTLIGLLLLIQVPLCVASQKLSTNSFKEIQHIAISLGHQYQPQHVLIAFDLDDTLLTNNQFLGSAPWFRWQAQLIKEHPYSPQAVAHTFSQLLKVQGILFALGQMHPVDPQTIRVIHSLQINGFKVITISERSDNYRNSTEQEFKRHNLWFRKSALAPQAGWINNAIPYKGAQPASYKNGILLISGDEKGPALQNLIEKSPNKILAILFIDDRKNNVNSAYQSFKNTPIDITTVHYTRPGIQLTKENEIQATVQWKNLQKMLQTIFPK